MWVDLHDDQVDGAKYEGFWYNDKSHGKSRMIRVNSDMYEGIYEDDKLRYGKMTSET